MELKIARQIARLSRQELAQRAGLDVDVITRIESGDRHVLNELPYRSVVHLAQALGVTPTVLFPVPPLLPTLPRLIDPPVTPEPEVEDHDDV
jgi:transcriptional regulator with XRE-family HTH domain